MLDNRTALLFTALLDLILSVYAWTSMAGQRTRASAWWCASGPIGSVGYTLLALRSVVPDMLGFNLGNLLRLAAYLVRIQSIRLQMEPAPRSAWMLVVLLIYATCYAQLLDPHSLYLSAAFNRGVLAASTLAIAIMSWRFARSEPSHNTRTIAGVFCLLALVQLLQFIETVTGQAPFDVFVAGDWMAELVTFVDQTAAAVSYLSYVGLVMDRSQKIQVKITTDLARADEDQQVQLQLTELTRQGSLNVMSATLGHELNQPLTAILTNAQVAEISLRTGRGKPALLNEFFQKMVFNTNRAGQIIDRMHSLNRPGNLEKNVIALEHLVLDTLQLMAQELQQHQVQVIFNQPTSSIRVLVDPIQLSQVLVNVVRNAVAAMDKQAVRKIYIDCPLRGERVVLTLADTGPGLSPEQLAQAGLPFYTTKANGMGIGLSISRAILERHEGTLTLHNVPTGGTMVELDLPAFVERRTR